MSTYSEKNRPKRGANITNILRDGKPALLYLAAYPEKKKGYALAEVVYRREEGKGKRKGRVIAPNKPGQIAREHLEFFSFNKETKEIYSIVAPLLEQLTEKLEERKKEPWVKEFYPGDLSLTQDEEKWLLGFLDGPFREMVDPQEGLKEYSTPLDYFFHLIANWDSYPVILRKRRGIAIDPFPSWEELGANLPPASLRDKLLFLLPRPDAERRATAISKKSTFEREYSGAKKLFRFLQRTGIGPMEADGSFRVDEPLSLFHGVVAQDLLKFIEQYSKELDILYKNGKRLESPEEMELTISMARKIALRYPAFGFILNPYVR